MSLFGFGDVNFNKQQGPTGGPLKALEGSQFESRSLRYPEDIGNYDRGHYMVFYIREQKNSKYAKNDSVGDSVINSASMGKTFSNVNLPSNGASDFGGGLLGKLNSGLGALNSATGGALSGVTNAISGAASKAIGGINDIFGQAATMGGDQASTQKILSLNIAAIENKSFVKTTQLTRDAIALYMPDTLQYTYSQNYDQKSMGGEIAGKVLAAGRSMMDAYKEGGGGAEGFGSAAKSGGTSLKETAKQALVQGVIGGDAGAIAGAMLGRVTNPMLEMIYTSPAFRSFQFDFSFYPRNEKEAHDVQQILERFRFHQAPEYLAGASGFLIPPSEFEIRFYYGGRQNPNIPNIATCILKSIDVNYAPNGFSMYEVPGEANPQVGRTGMPVAITLQLQFQETTILTKSDFEDSGARMASGRRGM